MTSNFDYYHDPRKPRGNEVEVLQYLYEKDIGKCYDLAQATRFYKGGQEQADYPRYFTNLLPTKVYLGRYLGNSFNNVWSKNKSKDIEPNPLTITPQKFPYYFKNGDEPTKIIYEGFFREVPCRALDNEINSRETSIPTLEPTLESLALYGIPTSATGLGNKNLKDSTEENVSWVEIKNKKCNKSKGCTIMGGKKYTKKSKKYTKKSKKNKRKSRKSRKSKN